MMCLSVVAQVKKILENGEAEVELTGVRKIISIELLSDQIKEGDWVLIHTGFAIAKLDEQKATEMLEAIAELDENI